MVAGNAEFPWGQSPRSLGAWEGTPKGPQQSAGSSVHRFVFSVGILGQFSVGEFVLEHGLMAWWFVYLGMMYSEIFRYSHGERSTRITFQVCIGGLGFQDWRIVAVGIGIHTTKPQNDGIWWDWDPKPLVDSWYSAWNLYRALGYGSGDMCCSRWNWSIR